MLKMFGFDEIVVSRALGALVIIFFGVLMAVCLDLISGIKKAKKRGEATTSKGLRMTIKKLTEYMAVLLLGLAPDLICFAVGWYSLPCVTAFLALLIVAIEARSMFEKSKDKKKYIEVAELSGKVLADKEEIIKILTEYLENEKVKRIEE